MSASIAKTYERTVIQDIRHTALTLKAVRESYPSTGSCPTTISSLEWLERLLNTTADNIAAVPAYPTDTVIHNLILCWTELVQYALAQEGETGFALCKVSQKIDTMWRQLLYVTARVEGH